MPMDIRKTKENFNKDRKPKCFNCEIYRYITKDCQKPKKEKNTWKYYECGQIGHITSDCKIRQRMKKWSV